jgi:hypothetical protein
MLVEKMVKCQKCGQENDVDADFCENCGANLNPLNNRGFRQPPHEGGMKQSTKILIAVCILLVAVLGVSAAALSQLNKVATVPESTVSSVNQSTSQANNVKSDNVGPKTFSNGIIYFLYPSNWDVLPNTSNIMAIVGLPHYPSFSVYDESKYGYDSLSEYVSSSESQMTSNGFSIQSERNKVVDGLPAHETIYQGKSGNGKLIIQRMVLVEKSPGSQYYALVGADTVNQYDQDSSSFDQVINSFKFL